MMNVGPLEILPFRQRFFRQIIVFCYKTPVLTGDEYISQSGAGSMIFRHYSSRPYFAVEYHTSVAERALFVTCIEVCAYVGQIFIWTL